MSNRIQISIPSPCHEKWAAMTPTEKGRFCASCQKQVLDLTNSSDREIVSILENSSNVCAKIRPSQMDRPLQAAQSGNSMAASFAVAASVLLLAGTAEMQAQIPPQTIQHNPESFPLGKIAYTQPKNLVTGQTRDESGNPLPAVSVTIIGTSTTAMTDIDGTFSIEAGYGQRLEFSALGYSKYVYEVPAQNKPFRITLKEEPTELMGDMIVVRKTFFGRIFYRIGNLFR